MRTPKVNIFILICPRLYTTIDTYQKHPTQGSKNTHYGKYVRPFSYLSYQKRIDLMMKRLMFTQSKFLFHYNLL